MNKVYGYVRVSTAEQHDDRQRIELVAFGVSEKNIFTDKVSGKDFQRPAYQKLKRKLDKADLLVVKSIDRLGRSYADILEEWRVITKVIKADILILDMPLLDTRRGNDLIGTLIADIVLQLLSYVAQTEREMIKKRQAEGIAAARLRGVHLGRRAAPAPPGFEEVYGEWSRGNITRREAARRLKISLNQFDWLKRREKRE